MNIVLDQVGKRFQRHWVFKNINYTFSTGRHCALLGANGSGKSTLLRIIAGMQPCSRGTVTYNDNEGATIAPQNIYKQLAFAAPGQDIIEEMNLREFFEFHFSFKPLQSSLSIDAVLDLTGLRKAEKKQIADFSSGMRQRVKLAQAIFTDTPLLLLDEPCTNLDQQGVEQYREWIEKYAANKMIIVASNDPREYFFCTETIVIEDYKE